MVAGDVYDRALPPVDAVRLADETLVRLARSRARVVVTSGNHDSAQRLGFSSRLIDAAGVFIRTDAAGRRHAGAARPTSTARSPSTACPTSTRWRSPSRGSCPRARTRRRWPRRCVGSAATSPPAPPAPGRWCSRTRSWPAAQPSDSERDISVGGRRPGRRPSVFDGVDYVALGHLHGAQTLTDRVRYSGSPLAYSFSEAAQRKGSWLVDLDGRRLGGARVRRRAGAAAAGPAPRGTLEDLLADPAPGRVRGVLGAGDAHRRRCGPRQAMERLRRRFPHALVLALRARRPTASGRRARRARPGAHRPRDRPRLRRRPARRPGHRRRVGAAPRGVRRVLRRHRRRHPVSGGRWPMRLHRLEVTAFGPFAEHRHGRLRRALRRRAVPALGRHRRRQDQRPRRRLLRALRRRARRAQRRQAAALRPGRRRRRARRWCSRRRSPAAGSGSSARPAWARPKRRGTGTTPSRPRWCVSERVDGAWRTALHPARRDRAPGAGAGRA